MTMRVGLIARSDNTGLGNQTYEFFSHVKPAKTLVVTLYAKKLTEHVERYPDNPTTHTPNAAQIHRFLDGLDIVYTAETPYNHELYSFARDKGIHTIEHSNYEFLAYPQRFTEAPKPSIFAAPSAWHFNDFPEPKVFLPVPIATRRFKRKKKVKGPASRFLHVIGHPATNDRNGTKDLLAALPFITSSVTVTLTCQSSKYIPEIGQLPSNVTVHKRCGDVENYWELYDGQDVLILPRRYGGLCLPAQESIGAGMPVIMPDVSPNQWLPAQWRTPAKQSGELMVRRSFTTYKTDPVDLAAKIDSFCDSEFYRNAMQEVDNLREEYSWDALLPVYHQVFADTLSRQP